MAGYSNTPLARKLGIRPGTSVALVGAPSGFAQTLGELPAGVVVRGSARGRLDLIVFFTARERELERRLEPLLGRLDPDGALWIAWPKRAAGVPTDVTENVIRARALAVGVVDNKVCAIDQTWSGLRLVFRVADRPALRAARGA